MSARKRGATGLSGILLVDKPAGMTSHDVVARVRRATGEGRVGHAGTLDPMATGLLVVLVGPATRLAPYLTAAEKTYQARIVFGTETDTDDADGRTTLEAAVPPQVLDAAFADMTVAGLVGTHDQVPPIFSAIKVDGVTSYKAARAGESVELESRTIEVVSAKLLGVVPDPVAAWDVELTVSKGTYIRAIARDLGRALGAAAHLGALRRTRSGTLDLAEAVALDALVGHADISARFADPVAALGLRTVAGDPEAVATGAKLPAALAPDAADGELVAVCDGPRLLAVYRVAHDALVAQAVFPGGITQGA